MKQNAKYSLITLAIVLLANPAINIIDIMPDFIAFFILARLIGRADRIVPYFAETKSALIKLGIISLCRIPATLIMFANMRTGRDILPLFTLIFAVLEVIFLVSAVKNGFNALFYLGERKGNGALIAPIKLSEDKNGKAVTLSTSLLCTITHFFAVAKVVVPVLPELCMLTFSSDLTTKRARSIYPIAIIASVSLILVFGIVWGHMCRKYVKSVREGSDIGEMLNEIAGEEKMLRIEKELSVRGMLLGSVMLFIATIATIDLSFDDVLGGLDLVPHFLFVIFAFLAARRLFGKSGAVMGYLVPASAILAGVLGIVQQIFHIRFTDSYELRDLVDYAAAKEAYMPVMLFAVLETAALLLLIGAMIYCFVGFVKKNIGVSPLSERYSASDRSFHKEIITKGIVIFSGWGLTFIINALDICLCGSPKLIFTDVSDVTKPIIAASALPWLPTLATFISIGLIIFAYMFTSELREDIKLKYTNAEES